MANENAESRSRNSNGLLISVIPQASIWGLQAAINYILVPHACVSATVRMTIHVVNALAFLVLVAMAAIAYRQFRKSSEGSTEDEIDAWPPERWMPGASFVLAYAFALVTFAQAIPPLILGYCQ